MNDSFLNNHDSKNTADIEAYMHLETQIQQLYELQKISNKNVAEIQAEVQKLRQENKAIRYLLASHIKLNSMFGLLAVDDDRLPEYFHYIIKLEFTRIFKSEELQYLFPENKPELWSDYYQIHAVLMERLRKVPSKSTPKPKK